MTVTLTPQMANRLLVKFAIHSVGCHCFICRTLTEDERRALDDIQKAA